MHTKIMVVVGFAVALAACSPLDYETAPVQVETSKGAVTCQLYTHTQVIWDRAINRPSNMGVQEADNVCLREGKRRLEKGSS